MSWACATNVPTRLVTLRVRISATAVRGRLRPVVRSAQRACEPGTCPDRVALDRCPGTGCMDDVATTVRPSREDAHVIDPSAAGEEHKVAFAHCAALDPSGCGGLLERCTRDAGKPGLAEAVVNE